MKLTARKTSAAIAGLLLASSLSVATAYAAAQNNACTEPLSSCEVNNFRDLIALTSQNTPNRTQFVRIHNFPVNTQNAWRQRVTIEEAL